MNDRDFDSQYLGILYSKLGDVYKKMRKFNDCIQILQKDLTLMEKAQPKNNEFLALLHQQIAYSYKEINDYKSFKNHLEQKISCLKQVRGNNQSIFSTYKDLLLGVFEFN